MKHKPDPRPARSAAAREAAEAVAIAALTQIAGDEALLQRFLAETGLDPAGLRDAAAGPGFLQGVLDHVAADESLLLAVAANQGLAPEAVMRARALLSGPAPDGLREG